jgi:hypothetical protein
MVEIRITSGILVFAYGPEPATPCTTTSEERLLFPRRVWPRGKHSGPEVDLSMPGILLGNSMLAIYSLRRAVDISAAAIGFMLMSVCGP